MGWEAKKILVVEDEATIREALVEALRDEGYDVRALSHGQEAWDLLQGDYVPQLMLLDLMMPVMGGGELLKKLRGDTRWAGLPVILFSAAGAARQVEGATDYLRKPIHLKDLYDAVRRYA